MYINHAALKINNCVLKKMNSKIKSNSPFTPYLDAYLYPLMALRRLRSIIKLLASQRPSQHSTLWRKLRVHLSERTPCTS